MRESIVYDKVPMPQDDMDQVVNIMTNVSSNGYYGYQPKIYKGNGREIVADDADRMEVQYTNNNNVPNPEEYMQINNNNNNHQRRDSNNRKRCSEHMTTGCEFKKRRQNGHQFYIQNDKYLLSDEQMQTSPLQKSVLHLRKPTHNIPDLPRCIMERSEEVRKNDLLEDILRETHGISMYHWLSSQD